jgi:hypothetical protein
MRVAELHPEIRVPEDLLDLRQRRPRITRWLVAVCLRSWNRNAVIPALRSAVSKAVRIWVPRRSFPGGNRRPTRREASGHSWIRTS